MNAWEAPGMSAEERAATVVSKQSRIIREQGDMDPIYEPEHIAVLASAIRAAERDAAARERSEIAALVDTKANECEAQLAKMREDRARFSDSTFAFWTGEQNVATALARSIRARTERSEG